MGWRGRRTPRAGRLVRSSSRPARAGVRSSPTREPARRDGSIPGLCAAPPGEDVASGAAQYSRRVAGGSVRGWFEADDLRRAIRSSLAFALVAAITQPSSARHRPHGRTGRRLDRVGARPQCAARRRLCRDRDPGCRGTALGQLEPVMFNVALLAFAAARWSRDAHGSGVTRPGRRGHASPSWPWSRTRWSGRRHLGRGHRLRLGRRSYGRSPGTTRGRAQRTRRQLAQQALLAERRRIARDVHDFVGHGLAAVMLQVTSARHVLRRDPDAAAALRSAEDVGRRSMQELRRMVTLLRSDDEAGRRGACPHGERDSRARRPGTSGWSRGRAAHGEKTSRDPAQRGAHAYRIAQEALANAARHAPRARRRPLRARARKADESLSWRRPADLSLGGPPGAGATSLRG